ncbi:MAG TPA: OPT family oligopeptide transporter [Caulobacteraceae bacterium]|nr:OPT family oligopeptide transporter [Caulobacteraceae bacterium]
MAAIELELEAHRARPAHGELTLPALAAAVVVAAIMGAAYPYMVLKLGFGPNVSIVSAFFGYLILSVMSWLGRGTYDRFQNNIVQTCGTSAAQTAFMCGILATFEILRADKSTHFTLNPTPLQTFLWLTTASLLGVILSAPMRRHFIVDQQLPFPDGMAAAETLLVLDPPRDAPAAERGVARKAAMVMGVCMLASGALMLVRDDSNLLSLIPGGWDTGKLTLGAPGAAFVVAAMGVGVGYSLLSFGSGMIVGLRINAWMIIGCALGWILGPLLLVQNHILPDHPGRSQVLQWMLWPGLGMMIAGGMTTLVLRWRTLVRAFAGLREASGEDAPLSWIVGGSLALAVGLCVLQKLFFGLPIWMSAVAILLSIPLMLVGLRALGETNWGPIGALSNLTQALFAGLAPGSLAGNVVPSGVCGTIAVTSEGLMQDYRAGYLIGSTPRSMFIAQLIGAPIGAAALAFTYPLLVKTYGLIGDKAQLAAPGSRRTAAFAELLASGIDKLPPTALWAGLGAAALGCVFAVFEQNQRIKRWVPSPVALSLGLLLPFSSISTMFLGAAVGAVWLARHPATAARYLIAVASGFIAGEAMLAVIAPALIAAGVGKG